MDDADKHMRELLEGALGEEVEVDVSLEYLSCVVEELELTGNRFRCEQEEDATVEGFRPNVQLMPHQVRPCSLHLLLEKSTR